MTFYFNLHFPKNEFLTPFYMPSGLQIASFLENLFFFKLEFVIIELSFTDLQQLIILNFVLRYHKYITKDITNIFSYSVLFLNCFLIWFRHLLTQKVTCYYLKLTSQTEHYTQTHEDTHTVQLNQIGVFLYVSRQLVILYKFDRFDTFLVHKNVRETA